MTVRTINTVRVSVTVDSIWNMHAMRLSHPIVIGLIKRYV